MALQLRARCSLRGRLQFPIPSPEGLSYTVSSRPAWIHSVTLSAKSNRQSLVVHTFNTRASTEVYLVYTECSQLARATQQDPVLKRKRKFLLNST